ncbi:FAD-dependent oxidoreductase [Saccharopolyspora sp. NPDC003752]
MDTVNQTSPRAAWNRQADVVVLGMGAAGCAAAIEAHDAGAEVVVLDKMPAGREGGNTRVSGGAWFHNLDPSRAVVYLRSLCGGYPVPEPVAEVWAAETQRITSWMRQAVGASVDVVGDYRPEFPELDGSDSYGGYLAVGGRLGDQQLFDALSSAVRARGIEVLLETPALELVQDATGAVLGVVAADRDGTPLRVRSRRGVVLATGGFEADAGMVRDYLRLPEATVWGTPHATGDGHRMAQKAGAGMWHMDNMMTISGLRVPGYDSGFYVAFPFAKGFIHLGPDGARCGDELPRSGHGHALLNGAYEHFPTRRTHVVFDEATRRAGPISPGRQLLPVGWNLLVEHYEWSADNSAEIAKGWIRAADTLEELAAQLEVDPAVLVRTVAEYNAACAAGVDTRFGRAPETLVQLGEGPYYSFVSEPLLAWSNGGPRRDEQCHVLDAFGAAIPGLYAAGSVSSTYSWCKDGGMHIADALAFGRVAGRNAAADGRVREIGPYLTGFDDVR